MPGSHSATAFAYDDTGDGSDVVFLHGLTFDRRSWRPITERLIDRYRCVAVDLPGHGETPMRPVHLDDLADELHGQLVALGAERPVIVGHSMSGILATIYAARHPTVAVVNVDQTFAFRPFSELLRQLGPALRGPGFRQAFEPFRASMGVDALPEPLRAEIAGRQRVDAALVLAYWDEPMTTDPGHLQARIDAVLAEVRVPYLAVIGHAISEDERAGWQRALPQVELEVWPAGGHMVHLVDVERFADRLSTFLGAIGLSSPAVG